MLPRLTIIAALAALAPAAVAAQVELRVQADAPGPDEQSLNGEYVIVSNLGTTPLDVSGWRLCDAVLDCFVLPDRTSIGPGGKLRVHSGRGIDTLRAIYMGRDEPLWTNWADVATLTDRGGEVRARCSWDRGRGLDCRGR